MLYMIFAGRRKGRRICLVYQMGGGTGIVGRLMRLVYGKGIRRFDGVIYTQPRTQIPVEHSFYMPDYCTGRRNTPHTLPCQRKKKRYALER